MTTLVECWNKLEGNVGELSSWVTAKDAMEDGGTNIPIEKLEGQLNQLKVTFDCSYVCYMSEIIIVDWSILKDPTT